MLSMKNKVKLILQRILGYRNYLYFFARYKIKTLHRDKKEKDFFVFMNEIKSEGDILDVGANVGIMTYHLAKKFSNRKIMAVEPMPSNFVVLKSICEKFGLNNIELIPLAVGESSKDIEMVLPVDKKVKMQGLAHVVHDSINEWNTGEVVTVACDTIDNIASNHKIAGIKMDIENFEYYALLGAKETLNSDKPVIYLELWENENRTKCFELLINAGYKVYISENNVLTLYQSHHLNKQNFIFKAE